MTSIAIELYRSVALSASESISPEASLLKCVDRICSLMNWQIGHVYLSGEAHDTLTSGSLWYLSEPLRFVPFKLATEKLVFTPGVGLVGKVLETGEARWILDASADPDYLRAAEARAAGLRSAYAFPIRVCGETLGVMEFYAERAAEVEPALFQTLEDVVRLLARVLKRKRNELEQVKKVTSSDPLTHLPNRAMFSRRLHEAIAKARRENQRGAVLFLDVDRFKVINETLGHEAGDRLLRAVAERLLPLGDQYDDVARLAGDQFTFLIPSLETPQAAEEAAQAVQAVFERPFTMDDHPIYLSVRIGGCVFPDDGEDTATVMKHATIALDHAKNKPGTATFYRPWMEVPTSERLILEHHLRRALEGDELVLHYQPQVCLRKGTIIGAEVLVRWQHPEMGLISPGKFIPLAEETGLIMPMTEQILRRACHQGRAWQDAELPEIRLAVNMSGNHFKRSGLNAAILATLEESGFPARNLELELTEGIMMENVEATIATLHELSAQGIHFAVDDFGTGYSSLSYLKRFPLSVLKIDQSFVRDIDHDPEDRAIVSAIIALAHRLHLQVIAEGVETEAQLRFLQEQGCDYAQGYFFSRPVPAAQMQGLLAKERLLPVEFAAARSVS